MEINQLELLGFEFQTLPSGRINIFHTEKFAINDIWAITKYQSKWFRTLEVKSLKDAAGYIDRVEIKTPSVENQRKTSKRNK